MQDINFVMEDIFSKQSPFIGEKVILRALEKSDVEDMMKYWNVYETRVGLGTIIPMSSMMEEDFINFAHESAKNQKGYFFAIENKETGEFLGTCSLVNFIWTSRSGVLGIAIHNPDNHDKGYGTDAMDCLLRFGFNVLNLHRIELWVVEYNKRAIHVYEKLGFKEIGRKREAHYLQGKYHDMVMMDILKREFENE